MNTLNLKWIGDQEGKKVIWCIDSFPIPKLSSLFFIHTYLLFYPSFFRFCRLGFRDGYP